jgi:hypothetical protein
VIDAGAVCGTALVTAFAAIVNITVPGEQPERVTVYVIPDPAGDPMPQAEEPVPDKEKSLDASPVTVSLNEIS